MKEIFNFINGQFVASSIGSTFENRNPVDNKVISVVHEAGQQDVLDAVCAAQLAFKEKWQTKPLAERIAILHKVADGIEARFEEFLEAECKDTGKPRALASKLDIPRGAANFRAFADMLMKEPNQSFPMDTEDGLGAVNIGHRSPKGVIAVICPWNLPFLLMTFKVAPALACGNTVVVKPSEETPSTTALLAEVMRDSGVPDGVYNVLNGFGPNSTGDFLTRHSEVNAITFTGETRTGQTIMQNSAVGLRDISMELGGKNPAIVFADCDLDKAIEGTLRSAFSNTGQVCLGTERIYVERSLYSQFLVRLKDAVQKLKLGVPEDCDADLGPLVSQSHKKKVLSYYKLAVEEGATVEVGGGVPNMPSALSHGAWIQPTIWTGLPEDARVIKEEIFGPCCHISPFDFEAEAIALANQTDYGLAAAIWTENATRAIRVSQRIEAGIVWVNSWYLRDLRTAFGGAKMSGIGREGGSYSLDFYTEHKNICIKL
ncbi:aldehyde dehydrogenase (plasmid) [Vibrio nigripulchritudo]|uniref:2-hydroxymuconic semialdehyde dehydrogenase n=1 Tax=Vibrio nigripulchritudo TaxID=28173 RepID=UPI00190C459B|nr:2-hydroxymuconic semialdehyde dehydrogenase [Vibrio nigripulchritudo]BCL73729.1 aldehyde dehydrogenase [Vibrio nigripulchritudo]BDU35104.1 aldehyde dehydrogenase [Vibrio nigripulchritudo]